MLDIVNKGRNRNDAVVIVVSIVLTILIGFVADVFVLPLVAHPVRNGDFVSVPTDLYAGGSG